MQKTLHIIAQAISILLYPLWIPTIGMILYCLGVSAVALPLPPFYWWISCGFTFFVTAVIPLSLILIGIKCGAITDVYIKTRQQRTTPYIHTIICYCFWIYFLIRTLHAPTFLWVTAIGATADLVLVTLINLKWKISSHLSGLGGLLGGIFSFCLYYSVMPGIALMSVFLLTTLLLMYSRIYLQAHDGWQVVAGFILALLCTFIPNLCLFS